MIQFVVKQWNADFVLQTNWMALGKEQAQGWRAPCRRRFAAVPDYHPAVGLAGGATFE